MSKHTKKENETANEVEVSGDVDIVGAVGSVGGRFPVYASLTEAYDAATLGYEIISTGATVERDAELAKCVHVVSGYALSRTLGEPFAGFAGEHEELTPAQVEAFANFGNACRDHLGGGYGSETGVVAAAGILQNINWSKLFELLAPILLKLLVTKQPA